MENYLKRCVESIINQTYRDIEIILVNDGSPDNCGFICDCFAKVDNRIIVIHKQNGGLSDARNSGLKAAKGDFVIFLDSDDYLNEDACKNLIDAVDDMSTDIVYGSAIWMYSNKSITVGRRNILENRNYTGQEFLIAELNTGSCSMLAWLGLYRRKFLIDNNLFFKYGILHEDEQWTPRVLLLANKVKYINYAFYNYVIREDSITQKKNKKRNAADILNTCYELNEHYKSVEDKKLKDLLNRYLLKVFLGAVYMGYTFGDRRGLQIDKKFVNGKALSIKDIIRVIIFKISPPLYCQIHRLWLNKVEE